MDVFDRIHVRSAWRIGKRLWIAKDPRIAISAAAAIIARLAARAGITLASWDKPAPYAIAEPWQRNDLLFVARHAPPRSHLVVADYAFATPAIAYALSPSAASAVVMHDSFSRRADLFKQQKLADSVVSLDHASEMKLLGLADAVIAIQKIEAADVQAALPDRQVIVAPMACTVTSAPQPGDRRTVLFIGSNTAPNIIGLQWFLDAAWPHVTKALADCRLLVAGGVAAGFPNDVAGVQFLGMVPDLEDLYREAGVVISPLTVGSGLKIKLIEALAHGKAVVATRVTTEGCDDGVIEAIFERDDPLAFAEAIVQLLSDDSLRGAKAAQALAIAKTHYSPEACYRDFRRFAETAAAAPQDAHKPVSAAAPTVLANGPSQ
jgi:succinoglycan biosynthesis protein ExoO